MINMVGIPIVLLSFLLDIHMILNSEYWIPVLIIFFIKLLVLVSYVQSFGGFKND
jgi:hypothetical protein